MVKIKEGAVCHLFLWSGIGDISRKSPISWKKVCNRKNQGGLHIITIEHWNKANLIKLLWNLSGKRDNIWIKWIHCYYIKGKDLMKVSMKNNGSWIIKDILKQRQRIFQNQAWG